MINDVSTCNYLKDKQNNSFSIIDTCSCLPKLSLPSSVFFQIIVYFNQRISTI